MYSKFGKLMINQKCLGYHVLRQIRTGVIASNKLVGQVWELLQDKKHDNQMSKAKGPPNPGR